MDMVRELRLRLAELTRRAGYPLFDYLHHFAGWVSTGSASSPWTYHALGRAGTTHTATMSAGDRKALNYTGPVKTPAGYTPQQRAIIEKMPAGYAVYASQHLRTPSPAADGARGIWDKHQGDPQGIRHELLSLPHDALWQMAKALPVGEHGVFGSHFAEGGNGLPGKASDYSQQRLVQSLENRMEQSFSSERIREYMRWVASDTQPDHRTSAAQNKAIAEAKLREAPKVLAWAEKHGLAVDPAWRTAIQLESHARNLLVAPERPSEASATKVAKSGKTKATSVIGKTTAAKTKSTGAAKAPKASSASYPKELPDQIIHSEKYSITVLRQQLERYTLKDLVYGARALHSHFEGRKLPSLKDRQQVIDWLVNFQEHPPTAEEIRPARKTTKRAVAPDLTAIRTRLATLQRATTLAPNVTAPRLPGGKFSSTGITAKPKQPHIKYGPLSPQQRQMYEKQLNTMIQRLAAWPASDPAGYKALRAQATIVYRRLSWAKMHSLRPKRPRKSRKRKI